MEHHYINKVQEQCRVCGRLLVAPELVQVVEMMLVLVAEMMLVQVADHEMRLVLRPAGTGS